MIERHVGKAARRIGRTQPAVSNDSENGRSQNRRVEIAIYANKKMKTEAQKEISQ